MNIRKKILIPMTVLTMASSVAVLVSSITLYDREIDRAMNETIHVAAMTMGHEIDQAGPSSRKAASAIAGNPEVIDAIRNADRDRTFTEATKLLALTNVEFCSITDSDGNIITRTHKPEHYGDNIKWQRSVAAALAGETATVVDLGTNILLSVRTTAPVLDEDGNVLGTIVLGYRLDTDDFVRGMKSVTGCEVTVFSGDERIATTIKDEHGEYAIGTKAEQSISAKVLSGERHIGKASVLGKEMMTEYVPLKSADDEIVGMMFVGKYTDEYKSKLRHFIILGVLVTLLVLTITVGIALRISKSIDRRISGMVTTIRDSEKMMQEIFDATPLMVMAWNENLELINTNMEAAKILGLQSVEEVIKNFDKLFPESQPALGGGSSRELMNAAVAKAFEEGHFHSGGFEHQTIDGERIPCDTTITRIKRGNEYFTVAYLRDLRGDIAAQAKLHEANRNRKVLLESLDTMIVITSLESDEILFMNEMMKDSFGFGDDIVGKKCWQYISKGDGKRCAICPKNDPDCISGKPFTRENFHPLLKREFRIISRVIDWPDGSKVLLEQCDDITDLKAALAQRNMLANLENVLNGVDAMICVTDPTTDTALFINDTMRAIFGIKDDYTGKKCYKVLRNLDERCEFCPCDKLNQAPEEEVIWEQYHPVLNNVYRSYSKYINWPTGQTVHVQHAVNITDMKAAEREIAEKTEQMEIAMLRAEAANKAKSTFLANMSHEIRTPMNAILGITEIQLRDENLPPAIEEGLEKIYDAGNLLLNIINDILDLSKIEAGKLEIIPVKYDLPCLVNDAIQINRLRYDSKPIEFFLDIDENTPLNMFGDELRLKQILSNILSNAFKYTDKGNVRMSVSASPKRDDDVTLVFRVSDTGQGMTAEQLTTLFDEYTRFNMDANRTTVGTGLGMNITKRLVDLMGGEISVESAVGQGTVFTVRLPQKRINGSVCGKDIVEKLRALRFQSASISKKSRMLREYMPYGNVLVVDDVESNIYVASGMLLPYGLQIDTALSGIEAIEKVKGGNVYDIIFMDHMMPKMDGIEAVKIIRGMGYKNTIVALTANALVGQSDIFLQNGFDGYISKPIDSRELNGLLNKYVRDRSAPGADEDAQADDTLKKLFARDAEKAVNTLTVLSEKIPTLNSEEMELYIVTVHGIKSALANIGEDVLSGLAQRLERAGKNGDTATLAQSTPPLLEALKDLIKKLNHGENAV